MLQAEAEAAPVTCPLMIDTFSSRIHTGAKLEPAPACVCVCLAEAARIEVNLPAVSACVGGQGVAACLCIFVCVCVKERHLSPFNFPPFSLSLSALLALRLATRTSSASRNGSRRLKRMMSSSMMIASSPSRSLPAHWRCNVTLSGSCSVCWSRCRRAKVRESEREEEKEYQPVSMLMHLLHS